MSLLYILIGWNVITFAVMGIDKFKAASHRWRISEKTLMALAFCMGAAGVLLGMTVFRHKTKHPKFFVGVPVALACNVGVIWLALHMTGTTIG